MSKAKRWCYTINNPTADPTTPKDEFSYHVYGREVGESGTPHLQGFIIFNKPKRLNQVKNLISDKGHYEVAKGKNKQASDYCKKDGDFQEFGTLPEENAVKGGQANKDVMSVLSNKLKLVIWTLLILISSLNITEHSNRLKQTMLVMFLHLITYLGYGSTVAQGLVNRNLHGHNTPVHTSKTAIKWWDHYQNEENVIIDDFDDTHTCLGHHLKRWADHYAFTAETKGGSIYIRPKWIIVTSQFSIQDIFHSDHPTLEALSRRFKLIDFNKHPDRVIN
ncbi:replication-associated protein [Wastewater CRESS DNA virus 3]|nr:replication-associated protein [Wastewater CRESS DNA virus 3]